MKLADLFEKQTIPQLQQSVITGFPRTKKRQHDVSSVDVDNITYTPFRYKSTQRLRVNCNTSTDAGNVHKVIIELRNVECNSVDGVSIPSTDNRSLVVAPVALNNTYVGVSCDCPDYIFRFATHNIKNDCHVGPIPPTYIRKTTTKPEANPRKIPGMCKHIMRSVEEIKKVGLIE